MTSRADVVSAAQKAKSKFPAFASAGQSTWSDQDRLDNTTFWFDQDVFA